MRLYLTVEGQTERQFVMTTLSPHLTGKGVFVAKPRLTSVGRRRGVAHRGGMSTYAALRRELVNWLKQEERANDVWFTTMIDLYGLPGDFPGLRRGDSGGDCWSRVARIEQAFAEDVGHERFIPYVQLHEFEALLLADPEKIGEYYPHRQAGAARLKQVCLEFNDQPERIDDGEATAPSKRIATEVPEYAGAKPFAGPAIAASITLETIRAKCPHFNRWLTKLEGLAAKDTRN